MSDSLPIWSSRWSNFATVNDLPFAIAGLIGCLLIILWWRQQSVVWLRVALATLLAAVVLAIGSYYLFVVPPHYADCLEGCDGWRGYPLRVAIARVDGENLVAAGDFVLNVIILWLLWLGASVVWRLLVATLFRWEELSRRRRILFIIFFVVLPWALLPRIINPPQPQVTGENLRLANNASRVAEFTYSITGAWIQRLALEDVQRGVAGDTIDSGATGESVNHVCLRGYTWFYIPWQRFRVDLDANGANALALTPLPLRGSCWMEAAP